MKQDDVKSRGRHTTQACANARASSDRGVKPPRRWGVMAHSNGLKTEAVRAIAPTHLPAMFEAMESTERWPAVLSRNFACLPERRHPCAGGSSACCVASVYRLWAAIRTRWWLFTCDSTSSGTPAIDHALARIARRRGHRRPGHRRWRRRRLPRHRRWRRRQLPRRLRRREARLVAVFLCSVGRELPPTGASRSSGFVHTPDMSARRGGASPSPPPPARRRSRTSCVVSPGTVLAIATAIVNARQLQAGHGEAQGKS